MPALLSPRKTDESSSQSNDKALVLPDVVQQKLDELGINGDVQVQAEADLDPQGRWSHRFLVATPQRLVVLSAPDLPHQGTVDTPTSKIFITDKSATVEVDLDIAVDDIISTEAKTLVGAASLEARVRNFPTSLSLTASNNANGALTNGSFPMAPRRMAHCLTALPVMEQRATVAERVLIMVIAPRFR
jgi:hypothetical protein